MSQPSSPSSNRDAAKASSSFVNSLAKGLEILSAFSEGDMLGNQQLVELTGLPKATVSRLTSTLVSLGYLRTDPITRKHFMGTRLLGMGASVQRRIGLQRIAHPYMTQLSAETGLTITLGTRDRLGLVILEVIRPPAVHRLVTNIDVGTVLPLASTALGLAYIVAAPIREQTQILESLRSRFSDEWPILRQRIEQAHSEYLRHGFVTTQRSWGRDVNGVAVPFLPTPRQTTYVFNFAGPATRMSMSRMRRELGPLLLQMTQSLRQEMQQSPGPQLAPPEIYEP